MSHRRVSSGRSSQTAARLGRVAREGRADVADAQPLRRIAHGDLRVAHRRPFEAFEALHAGTRRVAEEMRAVRPSRVDARLRRRLSVPIARACLRRRRPR